MNEALPERTPEVSAWLSSRARKGGVARMSQISPEQKAAHMAMMSQRSKEAREKKKKEQDATAE